MLTVDVVGTGRTTGNVRPNRSKMGWKRVPGDHQGGRGGKFAAAEAVTTAIHLSIGRKFAYSAVNRGRIGRLSGKCLLMMNAFCASLNFDAFIVFRSSPSQGIRPRKL